MKREDYFASGTKLVWQFDERTKSVVVYRPGEAALALSEADTLDGAEVLPGFTLNLREFWEEAFEAGPQ